MKAITILQAVGEYNRLWCKAYRDKIMGNEVQRKDCHTRSKKLPEVAYEYCFRKTVLFSIKRSIWLHARSRSKRKRQENLLSEAWI